MSLALNNWAQVSASSVQLQLTNVADRYFYPKYLKHIQKPMMPWDPILSFKSSTYRGGSKIQCMSMSELFSFETYPFPNIAAFHLFIYLLTCTCLFITISGP